MTDFCQFFLLSSKGGGAEPLTGRPVRVQIKICIQIFFLNFRLFCTFVYTKV